MSEKRTGCPRQRVQGSRRRHERDVQAVVGESPWGRHIESASFEQSGEAFFGGWLEVGFEGDRSKLDTPNLHKFPAFQFSTTPQTANIERFNQTMSHTRP